jgi:alpha-L-arabinofuranosidase
MKVNLSKFKSLASGAEQTVLTGDAEAENTLGNMNQIAPVQSTVKVKRAFDYSAPPMSLTVIRIKTRK